MPYDIGIPGQVSEFELRAIEAVAALIPEHGHMVEVGSLFGRSSYAWAKSCKPSVTVHCIDPWQGNEGVRAMAERHGVTYGLEAFRQYTSDCPNIVAHQGFSPRDFMDWTQPLDLYFEDAVHFDPVLSQNIEFWAKKLEPWGILCGDDYRPRFPDVRSAAERMAEQLGRRLQIVDFFWCLLPSEAALNGVSEVARHLDDLASESEQAKLDKGFSISISPVRTVDELSGKGPHEIDLIITNDGAHPIPGGRHARIELVAVAKTPGLRSTQWILGTAKLDHLYPDIPAKSVLSVNLEEVTASVVDIQLSVCVKENDDTRKVSVTTISGVKVSNTPAHAKIGDFVAAGDKPATNPSSGNIRFDDVVHAYRWILGREPEDVSKLISHSKAAHCNPKQLRMNIINSPEFGRILQSAGLTQKTMESSSKPFHPFHPVAGDRKPVVFIHLPKTGGTTVHYHLENSAVGSATCSLRHNDILEAPVHQVGGFRLYSGHFDARILHFVPNPRLVTVFREPGERLYSVYRHLRFTTLERQLGGNQDLAEVARSSNFEDFLAEAHRRNAGTVDNVYVRAFGGTLSVNRWERSAEAGWTERFGVPSDREWHIMIDRAAAVLGMQDVTVLAFSRLSVDLENLRSRLGGSNDEEIRHLKNSNEITDDTIGFTPLEIEPYASNETLERLTKHDRRLMKLIGASA